MKNHYLTVRVTQVIISEAFCLYTNSRGLKSFVWVAFTLTLFTQKWANLWNLNLFEPIDTHGEASLG